MKLKFVNSIQFVKISVYFNPTIQELVIPNYPNFTNHSL